MSSPQITPIQASTFDLYKTLLEEANHLAERKDRLDSLYVSLLTVILGGDGYVALISQFSNWIFVIVTFGILGVGLAIANRWQEGIKDINATLNFRYLWIRELEADPKFFLPGVRYFTDEYNTAALRREHAANTRTIRLAGIFRVALFLIPLLLVIVTAFNTVPVLQHSIASL
jgi:hypothetical protein